MRKPLNSEKQEDMRELMEEQATGMATRRGD